MKQIYNFGEINKLEFPFKKGSIIFLNGDLGAGKTTISKHILNNLLLVNDNITSPTYTYYNKYRGILDEEEIDIYHFDLYRLSDYDEFFAIGGEEILDNNSGIILIEWPDIIKKYYTPDLEINLFKTKNEKQREIIIK